MEGCSSSTCVGMPEEKNAELFYAVASADYKGTTLLRLSDSRNVIISVSIGVFRAVSRMRDDAGVPSCIRIVYDQGSGNEGEVLKGGD